MKLGIIGGSGLYDIEGVEVIKREEVSTPFGAPSDHFVLGRLGGGADVAFLPRHGAGHAIAPFEINHRANIYAMKTLGVTHILSVSAVGSLVEELAPRDVVMVDQYLDRTKQSRAHSFFGDGVVAHIPFGHPVCPELRALALEQAKEAIAELPDDADNSRPRAVDGGTYVNMEGPAFSTRAESLLYKSWGMDVIGMTNLGEAKLAREAEICYCTAAMVTDYDCWRDDHEHVSVDMVIANFKANVALAKVIIAKTAANFNALKGQCACQTALKGAILTAPDAISDAAKKKLAPIIAKYL